MKAAIAAIVVLGTAVAHADDLAGPRLAELAKAAKCGATKPDAAEAASPWRTWCPATRFAAGKPGDLPTGKILLGVTIGLETGHDAADALANRVTLSALAISADGKQVKLTDITDNDPAEKQMIAETIASIALVMKGKATTVTVPAGLAQYLTTLPTKYPIAKTAAGWAWTGLNPTRLRRVEGRWVAIEQPTEQTGVFATVLVDTWVTK
jgi:hypothetical protein